MASHSVDSVSDRVREWQQQSEGSGKGGGGGGRGGKEGGDGGELTGTHMLGLEISAELPRTIVGVDRIVDANYRSVCRIINLSLSACVCLCIYVFMYVSMCLSIYLSTYSCIHSFIHSFIHSSIHPFIHPSIYPQTNLSILISTQPSIFS
jgi:hypothetical protein